ncbi:unnamed protein product [Closterium sp. Naga37s-1]|nr:unnamed protein product [Closterium sp. Naga37s-1]
MPVSSITPGAAPEGLHGTSVANDTCQHSRLKAAEPDREAAGVNGLPFADVLATTGGTLEAQAVTKSLLTPWEAQQLLAAASAAASTAASAAAAGTNGPHHRTAGAAECTNAESLLIGGCDDFTSLLLMDPFSLVDSLSLPYPFTSLDSLPPAANALRGDSPRGDQPTGIFSTAAQAAAYGGEGSGGALAGAAGEGPSGGQNGDAEVGEGLPQASLDFMAQEELFQALLLEEAPESAARRLLSATCGAVMPADQPGEISESVWRSNGPQQPGVP